MWVTGGVELSNLKLEDLVVTCPRCNGTGRIGDMPARPLASMGLRAAFLDNCPDCESGKIYTPLGKTLREFVLLIQYVPR